MKRYVATCGMVMFLAACNGGGSGVAPLQPVQQPAAQGSTFALKMQAAPNGEASATLAAQPEAGTVITLVSQLTYDATRLTMKGCALSPQLAAPEIGKSLSVGEPKPGVVRTVVLGGLHALPPAADVMTCTFAAVQGAAAGPVTVHAEGNVSDMNFVARPFAADGTVVIGN